MVSTAASYDGVVTSWNNAAGAAINVPGFGLSIFSPDGTLAPFATTSPASPGNRAQSITGGGSGTDNNSDRPDLQAGTKRTNAFAYIDRNLTDNFNVFLQGIYSEQTLEAPNTGGIFCPAAVGCQGNQGITIFANNAYLPAEPAHQHGENNIASFTMGRIGNSADLGGQLLTCSRTRRTNPAHSGSSIDRVRRILQRLEDQRLLPVRHDCVDAAQKGGMRVDRLWLALDAVTDPATGNIVCNASLVPNSAYETAGRSIFSAAATPRRKPSTG